MVVEKEDYRYKGQLYAFKVEYDVQEGETEQGDYYHPSYRGPDRVKNMHVFDLEVFDPEENTWSPVTDVEVLLEIESNYGQEV